MSPLPPSSLLNLINNSSGTVAEVFEARCSISPGKIFIKENGQDISYGMAREKAHHAAAFLYEKGFVGQGHCVASFLSHRSEALWGWLGCQLMGTVHSFLNWEHRGAMLADMISLTGAKVIITEAAGWEYLSSLELSGIDLFLFVDDIPEAAKDDRCQLFTFDDISGSPFVKKVSISPKDISALIFSSGSTGRSKAVIIPHNMIVRGAARMVDATEMTTRDVSHFTNPLSHIVGQLHLVMVAIISGASLALYPRFSRRQFWGQVRDTGITYFCCFSNVIRYLMSAPEHEQDAKTTVRYAVVAQAKPQELAQFSKRFHLTTIDSYGMTEGEPLTLPAPGVMPIGSCGRVNSDYDVSIMDDDGNLQPVGEQGHIVFRPKVPDIMMKGYARDANATVSAWTDLWFHTQDIGYLDQDNFLYYVERLKFTIRRKGENIVPAELEAVVRQHSDVEDCVAIGIPTDQGEEDIKLFICPKSDRKIDDAEIISFCQGRVAKFMVPQIIQIMPSLPYTAAGKIDRSLLK